jgi:hypothetical protein
MSVHGDSPISQTFGRRAYHTLGRNRRRPILAINGGGYAHDVKGRCQSLGQLTGLIHGKLGPRLPIRARDDRISRHVPPPSPYRATHEQSLMRN